MTFQDGCSVRRIIWSVVWSCLFLAFNLERKSAFNASFFSSIPASSTSQRFAHPVDI